MQRLLLLLLLLVLELTRGSQVLLLLHATPCCV
jgi:hypothetical protein